MKAKVAVALLAGLALLSAGCTSETTDTRTQGTTASAPDTTAPETTTTAPTTGSPVAGTVNCAYIDNGSAARPVDKPQEADVPATGLVSVTLTFDQGDVTIVMDREKAPCAVNSFVSLAEQGYYNETICHRTLPGQLLQCGDPTGTGRGGPGYRFADELTGSETYPRGSVAMANSGADTNGSQFFLNYGVYPGYPNYVVLGYMDDASLAVLDQIAALGVSPENNQVPAEQVNIVSARVDQ
ncbi:MAG: peptidylprolyl isomerase [Propionibacteriaceae bacterium]|nr:peptidylprolyl isomerase [Propionibacteriaceae bacterium]